MHYGSSSRSRWTSVCLIHKVIGILAGISEMHVGGWKCCCPLCNYPMGKEKPSFCRAVNIAPFISSQFTRHSKGCRIHRSHQADTNYLYDFSWCLWLVTSLLWLFLLDFSPACTVTNLQPWAGCSEHEENAWIAKIQGFRLARALVLPGRNLLHQ